MPVVGASCHSRQKHPPAPIGVDSSTSSPDGGIAARSPCSASAASPGHRATSEQCRLLIVSPRPAPRFPALTTRYSLSSFGNKICRTLDFDVRRSPFRSSYGICSTNRCTIRNSDSAASCVCATCTVSVPFFVIVFKKNRADTQVLIPIWRAFNTMFFCPRSSSNASCAPFGTSFTCSPDRFRIHSRSSASFSSALRASSVCSVPCKGTPCSLKYSHPPLPLKLSPQSAFLSRHTSCNPGHTPASASRLKQSTAQSPSPPGN